MSIPGAVNPLLLGGGDQEYKIERSLRFNSSDSAYLSRTPASAGNRKTWTWAGWVKRSKFGTDQWVLRANSTGSDFFLLGFSSANNFYSTYTAGVSAGGENYTSAILRDPSAWYHLVCAFDTTQATSTNRVKLYINGVQQTLAVSNPPALNSDYQVNSTNEHRIGGFSGSYADFYLAEVYLIDGQALDPTSFGEFDTNGIWQPKRYAGTYGTNGFKLDFADNSSNTATTLGKDTSGNGNNWTPNNLSVTAGAGNDSLVDVPTNGTETDTGLGGQVRGNYATFSPLETLFARATLSNGNLEAASTNWGSSTIRFPASGKYYAEFTLLSFGAAQNWAGVALGAGAYLNYQRGGAIETTGGTTITTVASYTTNDVIGVAVDIDASTVAFRKNGSQVYSGTYAAAGQFYAVYADSGSWAANFGQRPFAYTAPSGFKALCTANLPAPTIAKPNSVFDAALWTGNGSARSITGLNLNPDFVWIKGRSGATDHALYDVVRGAEKRLESNTTDAEVTSDGGVTAFNSDGFSLGTLAQVNTNSSTYVGWTWDAGSSTVTNTQGSITSQVRANPSAGFSIVTYTGTSSSATVGHGLGVAPGLIIVKCRTSGTTDWQVYHSSRGKDRTLQLSATNAEVTITNYWGTTTPSSTVFGIISGFDNNVNGGAHVAYCFAPVAGYSAFGSYTGNGSTDGPFVYTGFRPRWVILKCSSTTSGWAIHDSARATYNVVGPYLLPNTSDAEASVDQIDFLSNGFKLRNAGFTNGSTWIYAAFAENPFQYARAR